MLKFDIITIFPDIFQSYFSESILGRARKEKLIDIQVHNLRDWTENKHRTVDDTPYGGGAGMVMKVEPIFKAVEELKKENSRSVRTIVFSAKGKAFTQREAERLSGYERLILICGRYEGIDERVTEHVADEEISIGNYVLTGGEIPAMVVVDTVARLAPGVLGNPESLRQESFSGKNSFSVEYPQYTKPESFHGWTVPSILLSGNHAEIATWREKKKKKRDLQ